MSLLGSGVAISTACWYAANKYMRINDPHGNTGQSVEWLYAFDIYMLDFKGAYLHAKRPPNMPIYLKPIPGMDIPEGKMPYLNKS